MAMLYHSEVGGSANECHHFELALLANDLQ